MSGVGQRKKTARTRKSRRPLCQRCLRSFKSIKTLTVHIRVCSYQNCQPRFKCVHCEKRFRTRLQYKRHVYYTHSNRDFTCPEPDCCRSFTSRSHLRAHQLTHSSERPFMCRFEGCTYRARTAGRLFQHKVIHGEGRRFSCDYCDYRATTSSNLRRHARIHAGARPYLCPHCDRRTSTLDALKKHVLDSGCHPGLPLYVCPWCSDSEVGSQAATQSNCVGFNASGLAWRHLTTEHQEKIVNSDRFKTLGRSSGKMLLERDVTRLLGIYCPEVDSTQPPEGVPVRQPAVISRHRRRRDANPCDTDKSMSSTPTADLSNLVVTRESVENPTNQPDVPSPEHSSSRTLLPSTVNIDLQKPVYGIKNPADNAVAMYHLVQLGSGALWSRDAFLPCDNPTTDDRSYAPPV